MEAVPHWQLAGRGFPRLPSIISLKFAHKRGQSAASGDSTLKGLLTFSYSFWESFWSNQTHEYGRCAFRPNKVAVRWRRAGVRETRDRYRPLADTDDGRDCRSRRQHDGPSRAGQGNPDCGTAAQRIAFARFADEAFGQWHRPYAGDNCNH